MARFAACGKQDAQPVVGEAAEAPGGSFDVFALALAARERWKQPTRARCCFGDQSRHRPGQSNRTRSPAAMSAAASSRAAIVSLSERTLSDSYTSKPTITATERPWSVSTVAVPAVSASSTISSKRRQASANYAVRVQRLMMSLWSMFVLCGNRTNRQRFCGAFRGLADPQSGKGLFRLSGHWLRAGENHETVLLLGQQQRALSSLLE